MKINEALEAISMLTQRIAELQRLRNDNSTTISYNSYSSKDVIEKKTPEYSVKKLDKWVSKLSKELRLLKSAVKSTNSITDVSGYESKKLMDIDLGELEDFDVK